MNNTTFLVLNSLLTLCSAGLAIYAIFTLRRAAKMRSNFAEAGKPADLTEVLSSLALKIQVLEQNQGMLSERITQLRMHLGTTVQKVGLIRFNSFADEGGNLSFACAILDEHDTGLVLTNMHGRQQNRIYAKPIEQGNSEFQLSAEERQAIALADQLWQQQWEPPTVEKKNINQRM